MKFALITFGNEESYGLLFVGGELLHLKQTINFFDTEDPDVCEDVIAFQPDFIFFSPMTCFFKQALKISRKIKTNLVNIKKVTAVFGGHHVAACPQTAELEEVDIVIVGPVRGAVAHILAGHRGVLHTSPGTPAELPPPAREQYYHDIPRMTCRYRKIMLSMLGCPWNCSYCSSSSSYIKTIFGKAVHQNYYLTRRPLADIMDEARTIIKYPTREIEWVDDDILAGPETETWILEFVKAWESNIKLPLYVSTTSKSVLRVSDQVLSTLKKIVNCVGMGIQAIRPQSLHLLKRAWDHEKYMRAAYLRLTSFGFRVNLQCIVGLPLPDPIEDAMETIQGLQRIGPGSVVSCYPLMIYPGTEMEAYIQKLGLKLNPACNGDTNSGVPHILFEADVTRTLRNICKLATMFVKYNLNAEWMRALIKIDFDEHTSRNLSRARYFECMHDRLGDQGAEIFNEVMAMTNLRY